MTGARLFPLLLAAPVRAAETLPGGPAPMGAADWMRWLLALALVLGAVYALGWLMRRLGHLSPLASGRFRVLGAVSLGTRERAVLLQAGGKQLVLGVAPGRVQTLCVLEGEDCIAVQGENAPALPSFAERLNQLGGKSS